MLLTSTAFASGVSGAQTDFNAVNPNMVGQTAQSVDPASDTLCQLILIINGRLGRVIAAGSIFFIAFLFLLGKVTWPAVVKVCIGIALLFAAKTVVVALLPTQIKTYNIHTAKSSTNTPEAVIRSACRELA